MRLINKLILTEQVLFQFTVRNSNYIHGSLEWFCEVGVV